MTEPVFQAPLPPQGTGFTPPPAPEQPQPQKESPLQDLKQKIQPYLWYVLGSVFMIGLIFGLMMGGGETVQQAPECALRHIKNPDIQGRFPICGRTSKTEACVLYIMNHTRYDKLAEDFFDEAARLTERAKYNISVDNPIYSKINIPPGYFTEIKIPSLR